MNHDDRRDLALRLEPDGIHDDANGEPDILLVIARDRAGAVLDMERIVACVNACRGIATENLPIIGALDDAERALINERTIPRWDQEASYINRGFAAEIAMRRAKRAVNKPTLEDKIDRILAAVENGTR